MKWIAELESMGSSDPVPMIMPETEDSETQYATDVDGGHDAEPVEYPVEVKMGSEILGADVAVELWPDKATVDGCEYSNQELIDLKSRGLPAADLREVHEVKQHFEGAVIPAADLAGVEFTKVDTEDFKTWETIK